MLVLLVVGIGSRGKAAGPQLQPFGEPHGPTRMNYLDSARS